MQVKVQVLGQALKYFSSDFKMDRCLRWTGLIKENTTRTNIQKKKKNHFKLITLKLLFQVSIVSITAKDECLPQGWGRV